MNSIWSRAAHIETTPSVIHGDIIVLLYDFPNEVHNEDSHYSHLAAGFLHTADDKKISLALHNP